ncbi:MAG: phage baseplate assembly protein V [Deltaproteobacteria bacterium]|jgi:uncharacterized protein involved in type VI secretion and phage assembly
MSTRFSGVVIGTVTNVEDPESRGRIQVRYPWMDSTAESHWASVAAPMAGGDSGLFFMPERDDEVLLAFEHGDFAHPYVVGFMWNGQHDTPSRDVRQRMIRSRNGHTIRFVDSTEVDGDSGALIIEDAHHNVIAMSNGKISIQTPGVLELSGSQVVIKAMGTTRTVLPNGRPI